jgi:phosphoribosylamine---glycine ligase
MKILLIGCGGREHAMAWKISESPLVHQLFIAPGNPGMKDLGQLVDISPEDLEGLLGFAKEEAIDLTVVGPEAPLVKGIVDLFRGEGLKIIGPDQKGAVLEGSKAYSKDFMERYGIPRAKSHTTTDYQEGLAIIEQYKCPLVLKADGLAGGKGVLICQTREEAREGLKKILLDRDFGDAGDQVVIEEFLTGVETSVIAFVDGKTIIPTASSRDYKRIGDGDQGLNTGGMGTYSPNEAYTENVEARVRQEILKPTLKGIQQENMDFRGIIFIGIMITPEGPKVLEYNVRFGDPETQVILARLETDLVEIFLAVEEGTLGDTEIQWKAEKAVCVILASKGYPEAYETGKIIEGLEAVDPQTMVFHSGTRMQEGSLVTGGGRVLGVTSVDQTLEKARQRAYRNAEKIYFDGKIHRRDIAG